MEVSATLFISLVIVALVQMLKQAVPGIQGWVTILVAFAVGIVVAILSPVLGVEHISIAGGIVAALGAIGLTTVASKAGGGANGDNHV